MIYIEFWADYTCPFCYIGFTELQNALQKLGIGRQVRIRHRAVMLHPDAPSDDSVSLMDVATGKYGHSRYNAELMARRIEERSVTTKYERKWLALGRSIFVLNARKTKQETTKRISLGEDLDMHARFRGPLPALALWKGFDGQGGTLSEGLWVYRNAFQSEDGIILLETIAIDQGFEQKYRLRIFSEDDRGIVKIDPYSFPFITPAVRKSVEDLASRLDGSGDGSVESGDCSGNERDLP